MPFVRAGIPAVELISLNYGPFNIFWQTPFDTAGKCSAVSLGIVGRVLLDALDDLESGRTPKPLLAFLESGAAGTRHYGLKCVQIRGYCGGGEPGGGN